MIKTTTLLTAAAVAALLVGCTTVQPRTTEADLQALYVEVRSELREMGLTLNHDTPVRFAAPGELGDRVLATTRCHTGARVPVSISFRQGIATRDIMAHELIHVHECLTGTLPTEGGYYKRHANVRTVLAEWSALYQ